MFPWRAVTAVKAARFATLVSSPLFYCLAGPTIRWTYVSVTICVGRERDGVRRERGIRPRRLCRYGRRRIFSPGRRDLNLTRILFSCIFQNSKFLLRHLYEPLNLDEIKN